MALNFSQILEEGELGIEVATELFGDVTQLEAGQAASVSAPVSAFGHAGTLTVNWAPAAK